MILSGKKVPINKCKSEEIEMIIRKSDGVLSTFLCEFIIG